MSQIYSPGAGGGGSGIIQTIDGDTGSITGAVVTIYANNAANNSGSSVEFVNSGTISTLNVTDINSNTMIGSSCGSLTMTGSSNSGFGKNSLQNVTSGSGNVGYGQFSLDSLTTGSNNCALGWASLDSTITGSYNVGLGLLTGDNFSGSESNCILLNSVGYTGQSNVLAIGQATGTGNQELNAAYIQGIYGNNQPVAGNIEFVTIDNTTGLLGVTSVTSSSSTTYVNSSPYNVLITDDIILMDTLLYASPMSVVLIANPGVDGQVWTIKDWSGQANIFNVTISVSGGSNIDGSTTFVLNEAYQSVSIAWSNSQSTYSIVYDYDMAAGGSITFTADTGTPFTTNSVTIYANNAANNSGSSVSFDATTPDITLNLTDASLNTILGNLSGNLSISGAKNAYVGYSTGANTTSGSFNCNFGSQGCELLTVGNYNVNAGYFGLDATTSGSYNIGVGAFTGDNQIGTENSTIMLNSYGIAGISNALFIGVATGTATQELNSAYIQGVYSNTQPVSGTVQVVTIDNTTGQLGVTSDGGTVTLNPDSGQGSALTGASFNIQAFSDPNFPNQSGSSVFFYGDTGTTPQTLVLNLSDSNQNTILGTNAGNVSISGVENVALGVFSMANATTEQNNVAIGYASLGNVTGGASYNTVIGYGAGNNYSGGETANILLQHGGVNGESNVMRLGNTTGTGSFGVNVAYIQGVYSNPQPISGTVEFVTIDNTTGLLGVTASASGSITFTADTGTPFSTNSVTIYTNNAVNNAGSSVSFDATTPDITLNLTDANFSTYIGQGAGNLAATAIQNVALGQGAMGSITTGRTNVAIGGTSTLSYLQDGTFNIAIGGGALQQSVSDSNNVAIGFDALTSLTNGSGNVSIGSNSFGNVTTYSNGIAIGNNAMQNASSGTNSIAIGYNALGSSSADNDNTGVGYQVMQSLNGGSQNTAVGSGVLSASTADSNNTGVGFNALGVCNGGSSNVAIGASALLSSVADNFNTAVGATALQFLNGGSNNSAFGYQAGIALTTGQSNALLGTYAGESFTSGSFNTIVGVSTFSDPSTGSYNTGIGWNCGSSYGAAEASNILINSAGVANENNALHIGQGTGTGNQQLSTAYISGINGNTITGPFMVVIDPTTDQLGVQAIPSPSLTWTDEAVTFNALSGNGYFTTAALTANLPATPSQGDMIDVAVDNAGTVIVQANTGQTIRLAASVSSTAGTATSTAIGCSLQLVYRSANQQWVSIGTEGSWILA